MSNARTFVNPNTAKSIVIMDNTTFEIFKASPLQIPIEISPVLRNLITVIFYY